MRKKIVLIADDDEVLCAQLVRALHDRGYHALGAHSLAEAIAVLDQVTPDLAVLDLRLSQSDSGLDVLRELRRRNFACKAIMLTGYGSIPSAVQATRLGIEDFVAKPADVDNILHALGELERGLGQADSETASPELPTLRRTEWEHIQRALHLTKGNISKASELLRVPRRTLQRKLQRSPES